ncbi:MAG: hypothetical protein LM600_07935, partial [Thaumarchaeota archaeon]|nr:hypothetical protein [Nitrososphaerota archaeon]
GQLNMRLSSLTLAATRQGLPKETVYSAGPEAEKEGFSKSSSPNSGSSTEKSRERFNNVAGARD